MTRNFVTILFAGTIACGLAAGAVAAPGDGIATACIKSLEAQAERTGKPPKLFPQRQPLCRCFEQRVKEDPDISNNSKIAVAEYYRVRAEDPKAARKIQASVPKEQGKLIGQHANACTKIVTTR
jgi:hypothetical protein